MRKFLMGAACVALAATAAHAEPGKGKGNDNRGGGSAKVERGKGGGNGAAAKARAERGPQRAEVKARGNGNGNGNARAEARGNADRRDARDVRVVRDNRDVRTVRDDRDTRDIRVVRDGRDRDGRIVYTDGRRGYNTIIDGCPPGLAKKNNGCTPPGLARKDDDRRTFYRTGDWQPRLFGLRNYDSGRYFYRDGYLLRYDDARRVSGYIPLLGGALAVGNLWPTSYRSYEAPRYYVDYYDLGDRDSYRYADNVIYRVDPQDAAIQSIAALLTGDTFTVGQRVPMGYDVYNVPYSYRDRYYDTPEAMYRYSDGYVYQIDPKTQLIAAAIDLVV